MENQFSEYLKTGNLKTSEEDGGYWIPPDFSNNLFFGLDVKPVIANVIRGLLADGRYDEALAMAKIEAGYTEHSTPTDTKYITWLNKAKCVIGWHNMSIHGYCYCCDYEVGETE